MTANGPVPDVDVAPPADDAADLRREGERIAQLIDDLATIGGAPVRQRAEELVQRLLHLYGAGLRNLLLIFAGEPPRHLDDGVRARIREDALLSSLLVLHDLHPDPEAARDFDPGPGPPVAAADLVQIDVGRSRAAKSGGAP